jgi:uncharacterized protein (DUF58 family)
MSDEKLQDILNPRTLSQIDNFMLLSRVAVEGFITGQHRSMYPGSGQEFFQYRPYTPGDDLKFVDWRIYARQDRYYTKIFQQETNMNCSIVLDASASMAYKGHNAACHKLHYASMLCACLAYLAIRQGDNVGLFVYDDQLREAVQPSNRNNQLQRICASLQRTTPQGRSNHAEHLSYISGALPRRGMVVILSDFLEPPSSLADRFKHFTVSGNDLLVVQVLDADEIEFPFSGSVRFVDSENGDDVITAPDDVAQDYKASMQAFMTQLAADCRNSEADYLLARTDHSVSDVLTSYLHARGGVY